MLNVFIQKKFVTEPDPPNKEHFVLERIDQKVGVRIFPNPEKVGYSDGYQIVFESELPLVKFVKKQILYINS